MTDELGAIPFTEQARGEIARYRDYVCRGSAAPEALLYELARDVSQEPLVVLAATSRIVASWLDTEAARRFIQGSPFSFTNFMPYLSAVGLDVRIGGSSEPAPLAGSYARLSQVASGDFWREASATLCAEPFAVLWAAARWYRAERSSPAVPDESSAAFETLATNLRFVHLPLRWSYPKEGPAWLIRRETP